MENFKVVCKGVEMEIVGNTKHKGSGCGGVKRWRKSEHNKQPESHTKALTTILQVVWSLREVRKISEKLTPRVCWPAFHAVLKKEKWRTQIWCMVLFPPNIYYGKVFVSASPRVTTAVNFGGFLGKLFRQASVIVLWWQKSGANSLGDDDHI